MKTSRSVMTGLLFIISTGLWTTNAFAGTTSANFNVTMTVVKECTVTPPSIINFGSIGAASLMIGVNSQSQTFTVLCSNGTPYTIQFSSPNDVSVGSVLHQLKGSLASNTNAVQYMLSDGTSGAANTSPLGGSASVITATGTGVSQTRTLQAAVQTPSGAVAPDVYTDTITMSVTY